MSLPGWYPDPGRAPGRFRYWDGQRWSAQTSPAPTTPPPGGRGGGREGSSRGWLIALVVLLVVTALVVVVVLATGGRSGGGAATEDTNSATPTVSAWNEVDTPTPTPPPTATSGGATAVPCPSKARYENSTQRPGRVSAGPIWFAAPTASGWEPYRFTGIAFLSDGHEWDSYEAGGYYSDVIGLGLVYPETGFIQAQSAAHRALECIVSNQAWDRPSIALLIDEAVTVDGHAGWRVRTNSGRDNQPQGEYIDVVMVDLAPVLDALGMFYSSVAVSEPAHVAAADTARESLRVGG